MSEHPHDAATRRGFESFVRGDFSALLGLFAPTPSGTCSERTR